MRLPLLLILLSLPIPALAAVALTGDSIRLDDGRVLQLEGIKASGDKEFGDAARQHLQELIADKSPVIEGGRLDRYGHVAANLYIDKIWLQGDILQAGLAFVYPPTGNEPRLAEMMKLEQAARQAKRGIWGRDEYADQDATNPKMGYGHFAFVTGKVVKAERIKNMFYLNFGDDWKKDFTVAIAAHDLHFFRAADVDPEELEGKTIRVRGWIKRMFGPMITITHPAQIEVLGDATAKP